MGWAEILEHMAGLKTDPPYKTSKSQDVETAGVSTYKTAPVEIDEDVRNEYWTEVRKLPDRASEKIA